MIGAGLLVLALSGCTGASNTAEPPTAVFTESPPSSTAALTLQPAHTTAIQPTALPSATPSPTETSSPTATLTPAPTETPTPTPQPTYITLRGEVIIDQAVCHYGPGAPYLYKYGVYKGSHLEVIRRVELGNYIEVQAIGGNNPCWVRADYLEIEGDLMNVKPVSAEDVRLPMSPYYPPPAGVSATRSGSLVTVSWPPFQLRPGDDSEQYPYLVESWVCQGGQMVFLPVGSYETSVQILDEPGCAAQSHGRFYAVEKHGYTRYLEIPWPSAGQ